MKDKYYLLKKKYKIFGGWIFKFFNNTTYTDGTPVLVVSPLQIFINETDDDGVYKLFKPTDMLNVTPVLIKMQKLYEKAMKNKHPIVTEEVDRLMRNFRGGKYPTKQEFKWMNTAWKVFKIK